nr:antibiotic biosynthesis monooxygenase [Myxococcota bacterium]
ALMSAPSSPPAPPSAEAPSIAREPVTVVVARRARQGRESALEDWLRGVIAVTSRFPGYLGSTVIRPRGDTQPEHVLVFRFASSDDLRSWQQSSERAEWLRRAEPLTEEVDVHEQQGLEPFFDLPSRRASAAPPPRWKMAIVTWIALYPLILGVGALTSPLLDGLPLALETAIASAITVALMAWLAMPLVTRAFARFLYPRSR